MKCEEVQEKVILEEGLSSAVEEHISSCLNCQEFKSELELMMNNKVEINVPPELDRKIIDFARENRPVKKDAPVISFVFMAVAALIAISLTVNFLQSNKASGNDAEMANKTPKVEKTSTVEVVAAPSNEVEIIEAQDELLENLWGDDEIDADLLALESEIFVLSAELYVE